MFNAAFTELFPSETGATRCHPHCRLAQRPQHFPGRTRRTACAFSGAIKPTPGSRLERRRPPDPLFSPPACVAPVLSRALLP